MPGKMQHGIDPTIDRVVGLKLQHIRKQKGLTQEMLSALSGIGRTSIANIETGRQSVQVATLVKLADSLGIHPGTLLPRNGEMVEINVTSDLLADAEKQRTRLRQVRRLVLGWHDLDLEIEGVPLVEEAS